MPSTDLKFSSAEIDILLHATESSQRVLESVYGILAMPPDRFSISTFEGHYKNKIILLTAILSSQEAAELAINITSHLNSHDKELLANSLDEYSDEKGNLYLRLDKQRICQGKILLSDTNAIRIRFKPIKRYKRTGSLDTYRGLLSSTE